MSDPGDPAAIDPTLYRRTLGTYTTCAWRTEVTGAPVLDGVLSWIDCSLEAVEEAGDHWWVTGRVLALANARDDVGPLQFFRGAYGDFAPLPSS